jgi:hypothetical protein
MGAQSDGLCCPTCGSEGAEKEFSTFAGSSRSGSGQPAGACGGGQPAGACGSGRFT